MFGTFRLVLALMVAFCHLWHDQASWWGMYAVFGFYTLSGYLMTLVLNERYWGTDPFGTLRFLANRALRVYPPYLTMVMLALAIAWFAPAVVARAAPRPMWPDTPWDWLINFSIFGLASSAPRLIPQAFSLDIELQLYVAMAFVLARSRWTAALWTMASLLYTGYLVTTGANMLVRYVPPLAASLPFSVGSLIYYLRDDFPVYGRPARLAAVGAFVLHASLASVLWRDVTMGGFYVSLGLVALVVVTLQSVDPRTHRWGDLDQRCGDLSYPLFLCHIHAGALVFWALPSLREVRPGFSASLGVAVALVLAWVLHRTTEVPIAPLRARLHPNRFTPGDAR